MPDLHYTPCTQADTHSYTHTHKSDIHEIIFFEASVELNDNEILSTCFYVYYAKLLYLSHLPAPPVYFFLIYQIQFLFHCVIVAAKPKIFSEKISVVVIPAKSRVPPLLFRLPATPPLVNRCKQKMQVALYWVQSFQNFLWTSSFWRSGYGHFWVLPPWKETLPFPKASK